MPEINRYVHAWWAGPLLFVGGAAITGTIVPGTTVTATLVLDLVVIVCAAIWYHKHRRPGAGLGRLTGATIGMTTAVVVSGQLLQVLTAQMTQDRTYDSMLESVHKTPMALVLTLALIVAPLSEELLVRGVVQTDLMERVDGRRGQVLALVVSVAVFTALHGTLTHVPYVVLGGTLLALVRLRTGRLRECVVIHMTYNALSLVPTIEPARAVSVMIIAGTVLAMVFYARAVLDKNPKEN